jgi:hypothetical protein
LFFYSSACAKSTEVLNGIKEQKLHRHVNSFLLKDLIKYLFFFFISFQLTYFFFSLL